jgi:hypothetical protein
MGIAGLHEGGRFLQGRGMIFLAQIVVITNNGTRRILPRPGPQGETR